MAPPKSKSQITVGKSSKQVKLGASTSAKPSALMPKKDYSKNKNEPAGFGVPSFGLTGLTGES